jgi:hypothetical protein
MEVTDGSSEVILHLKYYLIGGTAEIICFSGVIP